MQTPKRRFDIRDKNMTDTKLDDISDTLNPLLTQSEMVANMKQA